MGFPLRTAISLQLFHHSLDVLGFGPVRDQYGIIGFHNHQVFHPKAHNQPVLAAQVAIAALLTDHSPLEHISVAVAITGFPEGAPAADIAPTNIQRQH